jgi:hypothetical protein
MPRPRTTKSRHMVTLWVTDEDWEQIVSRAEFSPQGTIGGMFVALVMGTDTTSAQKPIPQAPMPVKPPPKGAVPQPVREQTPDEKKAAYMKMMGLGPKDTASVPKHESSVRGDRWTHPKPRK